MDFDAAFDRLMGHEGGYVNDPQDPGGETNWGISKRAYPDVDIKHLTRVDAKKIYRRDYWDRAKADSYHSAIGFQVFDAAVNHGIGTAIRFLQRAAGVADDGVIGPISLGRIRSMDVSDLLMRFNGERLMFYTKLSTWSRFGKGWARRVAANLMFGANDS